MSFLRKLLMFHAASVGCQGACLEIQQKIHTSTLTPRATKSEKMCFIVDIFLRQNAIMFFLSEKHGKKYSVWLQIGLGWDLFYTGQDS